MSTYIEWAEEMKDMDIDKAMQAYQEGQKFNEKFKKRRPYYQLELFDREAFWTVEKKK
jgi:hypothetical protein